jgi:hypothetical protein
MLVETSDCKTDNITYNNTVKTEKMPDVVVGIKPTMAINVTVFR